MAENHKIVALVFLLVAGSDTAGQNEANITAPFQSAILMLHHIDEPAAAQRIQTALEKVYAEGTHRTRDLGGTTGTKAFAEAVIAAL